jgi:CII-binding regulator of phage lambda lysogenization HflD
LQTYIDATIQPGDSTEEKIAKLYLSICSVGEQLYSAGSAVAELTKKLNGLEKTVADFRRDLATLKREHHKERKG